MADNKVRKIGTTKIPIREKFYEIFWVIVLLASCTWFFSKSYRTGHSFGIWQDNEYLYSPIFHSMATLKNHLAVPSYLPEFLGGLDLQGFAQFSPLYPFYFIGSSLFKTPESSMNGLNFLIHIHLLIFIIGAYYFLRILTINRFAAAFAAVLIVFNSNTLNYATWISILAPYAWLPWILGSLIRALKKNSYGSWTQFYFFCIMLIFAAPAQAMVHAVFLIVLLILSEAVNSYKNSSTKEIFVSSVLKSLFLSPIFLAIVTPVLWPTIIGIKSQIRWVGNFPAVIGNAKIPFNAFLTTQVELPEFKNLLFPPSVPRAVGGLYLGFIVIGLLIYGIFHLYANRYWKFFFLIGMYSLISSFGSNFGLAYVNYYLPLLNLIREPSRFLVIAHLAFGVCAAFSLNNMCERGFVRNRFFQMFPTAKNRNSLSNLVPALGVILILTLSVAQSNWINWNSPDINSSDYRSADLHKLEKVFNRINQLDPSHEYRVIFNGKVNTQNASMFAAFQEIRTLNIYMNPLPVNQFNSIYFYNNFSPAYKELLGAKYLVCAECSIEDLKGYENYKEIWSYDKYKLLENSGAVNFLNIPKYVIHYNDRTSNFAAEIKASSSPGKSVFIQSYNSKSTMTSQTQCEISKISQVDFLQIDATTNCRSNAVLVLNSYNDGNWRATINGIAKDIESVDGVLVGIKLTSGSSKVHIIHVPVLRNYLFRFAGVFIFVYLLFFVVACRSKLLSILSGSSMPPKEKHLNQPNPSARKKNTKR